MRSLVFVVALIFALLSVVSATSFNMGCVKSCVLNKKIDISTKKRCFASCKQAKPLDDNTQALWPDGRWSDEEELADSNQASLVDERQLWEQYRTQTLNALAKGSAADSKPYLQLLTAPIDADWDEENPALFGKLCDTVPYWSPYWSPSPYSVSQQYASFVSNVAAGRSVLDGGAKAELDAKQSEFAALNAQVASERMKCWMQYRLDSNPNKGTVQEYEVSTCGTLAALVKRVADTRALIDFWTVLSYGTEHAAILESRNDVLGNMDYSEVIGSLRRFRTDIRNGVFSPLSVQVSAVGGTQTSKPFQQITTGLRKPTQLDSGLFNFITSGSGITTTTEQFKMSISFKSHTVIQVAPQRWFRSSVISKYGNGPFINPQSPLFGDAGTMRLRTKSLYVVYQPRVEITMSVSDAYNFRNNIEKKSGGLFSSKRETAAVTTDAINANTMKVTIQSNSDVPQIIAIDNELLG